MKTENEIYQLCVDGMPAADLRRNSCIKFINQLRESELIIINRQGRIRLTRKGRIARNIGLSQYLDLSEGEKEFFTREIEEIQTENTGLMMVFGGLVLCCMAILGFWFLNY